MKLGSVSEGLTSHQRSPYLRCVCGLLVDEFRGASIFTKKSSPSVQLRFLCKWELSRFSDEAGELEPSWREHGSSSAATKPLFVQVRNIFLIHHLATRSNQRLSVQPIESQGLYHNP